MTTLQPLLALAGRIMLSILFLASGWAAITGYAGTQEYMESAGLPGSLLPLAILAEIVGGLMIVFGFYTRCAALALAAYSVVAAIFFHVDFADVNQLIHFQKNLAIAGGFLILAAFGPGAWAFDRQPRTPNW
jgi:putative oxidoreductase